MLHVATGSFSVCHLACTSIRFRLDSFRYCECFVTEPKYKIVVYSLCLQISDRFGMMCILVMIYDYFSRSLNIRLDSFLCLPIRCVFLFSGSTCYDVLSLVVSSYNCRVDNANGILRIGCLRIVGIVSGDLSAHIRSKVFRRLVQISIRSVLYPIDSFFIQTACLSVSKVCRVFSWFRYHGPGTLRRALFLVVGCSRVWVPW